MEREGGQRKRRRSQRKYKEVEGSGEGVRGSAGESQEVGRVIRSAGES